MAGAAGLSAVGAVAGSSAARNGYFMNLLAASNRDPQTFGKTHQCFGDAVHSPFYQIHAITFDVGDDVEGCWRCIRGGATIGGITPKKLQESWVFEIFGQCIPKQSMPIDFHDALQTQYAKCGHC